jgi:hypothetical protein
MRRYLVALLLSTAAVAQTHIPATGLCNTGLTPASPLPTGCTTSTPVTPINPTTGGSSVDGNWQLATPYPSASYSSQTADPCKLTSFGPAWVDAPPSYWLNPDDGLSQWISPQNDGYSMGGWFIYRTAFPVPPIKPGHDRYLLTVAGNVMGDDVVAAIFLRNPVFGCVPVSLPSLSPIVGSESRFNVYTAWNPFDFAAVATPDTMAYLYFLVYNLQMPDGEANGTGFRVEFTSAYFTPE